MSARPAHAFQSGQAALGQTRPCQHCAHLGRLRRCAGISEAVSRLAPLAHGGEPRRETLASRVALLLASFRQQWLFPEQEEVPLQHPASAAWAEVQLRRPVVDRRHPQVDDAGRVLPPP